MGQASTPDRYALTPEELASFRQNGYCGPFRLYETDEIAAKWRNAQRDLFDRSQAVYSDESAVSAGTNISNYDRHLDVEFLADHICRQEIVGRVRSILGPDVLCWRSEFFPKYPGDEGTDWHQADTFANASGEPQIVWRENRSFGGTITVWCAFTDALIDTGCLQFIPGTHEQMNYDESKQMTYNPTLNDHVSKAGQERGFFGYDYRQLQIDPDWEPDESQAVSMEVKAGEFIIFWSTLMHASHAHAGNTKNMRLGYVGRYVPTSVQVYPDTTEVTEYGGTISLDKFGCVLVSGTDHYQHNTFVTETTRGKQFIKAY